MSTTSDAVVTSLSVAALFRHAMASVATPVAVVTAMDENRPHGTTVSAFMSLSMNPPMMAVALDNTSELLAIIRGTERFGVNVLSLARSDHALAFAGKGHDKFTGVSWTPTDHVPKLDDLSAWIGCDRAAFVQGGDHTIVLGRVVSADSGCDKPLTYHQREFGTHTTGADDARNAHVR
ncbi:flavin reductase family protein [Rhodococcus fascians]|nr:flavin reductase family protein [Rhodococcus fascians]MBY3999464.1 flavin reductase family protein [Rhodococcus fascians]MBY4004997.1 flavin reductase family protein [Rhodococcus fascians]MBY4010130.1 flavin reductase family protein [Rhodococcus fascians]MBY4020204.1 flavin reductase family protein [Rhodococcus fascians]